MEEENQEDTAVLYGTVDTVTFNHGTEYISKAFHLTWAGSTNELLT